MLSLGPWMFGEWIVVPVIYSHLAVFALLIAALAELKEGRIRKIGVVLNVLLLWQVFYPVWDSLSVWFQYYLDAGSVLATVAFVTYFSDIKLKSGFHRLCFLLYGSATLLIAIVWLGYSGYLNF